MNEVILNDECMHCNNRECHDGEHFCNQAMKENSFYKNAKLYKGLEVIHRPTYEELEKENAELKGEADSVLDNWCRGNDPCPHLKKRDEQLTKAKFLLKQWVELYKPKLEGYPITPIQEQTEQFLSKVEK